MAKTSVGLAILSLAAFAVAHLGPLLFGQHELFVAVGGLFFIDWKSMWSWQVFALLASALSIVIVLLVDDVSRKYRRAKRANDAKLLERATNRYGWIERLRRVRLLLVLAFWGLVGTHAVLYFNSQRRWFSLPPAGIYGDRLPHSDKCPQ